MRTVRMIAGGLVLLVGLFLLFNYCRARSYRNKAALVKIGESQSRVQEIMGKPTASWESYGVWHPNLQRWWEYGSLRTDWEWVHTHEFPWFRPTTKYRWIAPPTNIVVVFFDEKSNVMRIQIPSK